MTTVDNAENQFSDIADDYKSTKGLPYNLQVVVPSFQKLLGSLVQDGSCNVVDLACGEGFYTRMAR